MTSRTLHLKPGNEHADGRGALTRMLDGMSSALGIKGRMAAKRADEFRSWLEIGEKKVPSKLIANLGEESAVSMAHGAFMGGHKENALKAVAMLGKEGREQLISLCREKVGAERAFAAEMLGHVGEREDLALIAGIYSKDPMPFVKRWMLLAAAKIGERFPGCSELDSCIEIATEAMADDALHESASALAKHFSEEQRRRFTERAFPEAGSPVEDGGASAENEGRGTEPGYATPQAK